MTTEPQPEPPEHVATRAALHRALGDETRLTLVDALALSDRTPSELGQLVGASTNLLAFHLGVLEEVGLVVRRTSEGDARRRYVGLVHDRLWMLHTPPPLDRTVERVLFVCTANSARSQLAAQLWRARTGLPALSAGTDPAPAVHPLAVAVGEHVGLDLADAVPTRLDEVELAPDLAVSVCDRAHETPVGADVAWLHWSVPDPVGGDLAAFSRTVAELRRRIDRLAEACTGAGPGAGPDAGPGADTAGG